MAEVRTITKADLINAVPDAVTEQLPNGDLVVAREKLIEFSTYLRDQAGYDYLSNVTGVDYLGYKGRTDANRFEVVYHVYSTKQGGGPVVMHVRAPANEPSIPSVITVWPGTDLQEREIWDLYGIRFPGHPNLRRILLWEGFNGHPLRKDWKEAYFEEETKPFKSRHPGGGYHWHEDKLPWGDNNTYPAGWDPDSWEEPVTYVPVSQAPHHGYGELDTESIVINLGPHHPSTHGVFRMLTRMEGETILALEPEMGYLHRNHEKIGESGTYLAAMPFTDRLDYINSMSNNFGYALAVEKLLDIEVPERAQYIRGIVGEISRITDHLTCLGASAMEVGGFTPFLWMIKAREWFWELLEELTEINTTHSVGDSHAAAEAMATRMREPLLNRRPATIRGTATS